MQYSYANFISVHCVIFRAVGEPNSSWRFSVSALKSKKVKETEDDVSFVLMQTCCEQLVYYDSLTSSSGVATLMLAGLGGDGMSCSSKVTLSYSFRNSSMLQSNSVTDPFTNARSVATQSCFSSANLFVLFFFESCVLRTSNGN